MTLINVNLITRDIDALCTFYAELFGFAELDSRRTAIYRCLDAGGIELGFNAPGAYDLLHLEQRRPTGEWPPVTAYCSFLASDPPAVDKLALRCAALGGRVVRAATVTHYHAYQVVLEDPQHHVFRVQCPTADRKAA